MGDTEKTIGERMGAMGARIEELAATVLGLAALPSAGGALAAPEVPLLDGMLREAWLELLVLDHGLAALLSRLKMLRRTVHRRQVEALGLPEGATGLRLALTGHAPPPWITIGFPPARVVTNLRWGIPLPDGCAAFVFFALALEHFYYDRDARALLREARRVLAPGGALRLIVPDLEKYARAYAAGDQEFFDAHRRFWPWARHMETAMDYVQCMSGAGKGRGPGSFFDHKVGYDFETLAALLRSAGFARIERSAYMRSAHPDLRIDDASHDAGFACRDLNYNLFVDAS